MSEKENKKVSSSALLERYKSVIDRYHESKKEPKAFMLDCLQAGTVSVSDAAELVNYLASGSTSRSFALADLSDKNGFRLALYETSEEGSESPPLFVLQLDQSLQDHAEELGNHLEMFAHKVAELSCGHHSLLKANQATAEYTTNIVDSEQEILNSILESVSSDITCH